MDDRSGPASPEFRLVLGIDTCGPAGSVALARVTGGVVKILGQTELEGRSYSATLVRAVEELLAGHGRRLRNLDCLVVVKGPGSFTGVRVGLSAAKGLAEGTGVPVVAVSRLEVLAWKAGVPSAALDAHRHEVFLRIAESDGGPLEMLAGAAEFAGMAFRPPQVAVCDEAAAGLMGEAWPGVELVTVLAPTAADAVTLAAPHVEAGDFVDAAVLDGHYLRRSDAEIFGPPGPERAAGV